MDSPQPVRSLNTSRLQVPARSEGFTSRARVSDLLDAAISCPTTVVTGPAGTGKTLAVADWTRAGRLPGTAVWVSLERGDADTGRFWASILSAVAVAVGPDAFDGLEIPDVPDPGFLHDVATNVGGSIVLILDDVHELEGGTVLDWLEDLLRWPPDGVRIVLISRHDPPIALQRLRLEGTLAEIRFADLAFTADESVELLNRWGVILTSSAMAHLMATTGGWVAALRLVALTLRTADDPSATIERLGGPTFLVSEYLWDEVLRLLPPSYGEFLLRTSISTRLCALLATELTGEPRADVMLRTLAREELLVQDLEGTGWYRTHSLMTEVLRARLKADRPDLERELHRKAALWFEAQEAWMEALQHAIASGDWDFTGPIAMRTGAVVLFLPDRGAFVELMERVPGVAVADHPEMMAAMALAAYCRHESFDTHTFTARAEAAVQSLDEPRRSVATFVLNLVRAAQAHRDGDALAMRGAAAATDTVLSGLSAAAAPGWVHFRGVTLAMLGVAELWSGDPQGACELLRQVGVLYPVRSTWYSEVYYRGLLALAQCGTGRLAMAQATAEAALEAARARGRSKSYETQWAWLALAIVHVYAGDAEAGHAALAQCEEAGGLRSNPFVATVLRILTARKDLIAGDVPSALRGLAEVDANLARFPRMGSVVGMATALRVDLQLAAGASDRARAALAAYDRTMSDGRAGVANPRPDSVSNCRARFLLSTGQPEQVRATVAPLLDQPGSEAVQAWLSVALAEERLRHDSSAIEALARALDNAEPENMVMPFLRPGTTLTAALRRHLDVVGTHREFVERALASAPGDRVGGPERTQPSEPLTERERAVLAYLPTMGSNADIAVALSISENTVKQHLKSIYRKLGVRSRREAVRVGRDNSLLPWQRPDDLRASV